MSVCLSFAQRGEPWGRKTSGAQRGTGIIKAISLLGRGRDIVRQTPDGARHSHFCQMTRSGDARAVQMPHGTKCRKLIYET